MVIKWKGQWRYKQYNPNKPSKYHIKAFVLCDSAIGYAYNILTYFGSEMSYGEFEKGVGQSEKIVEYLLRPLGTGHHQGLIQDFSLGGVVVFFSVNEK